MGKTGRWAGLIVPADDRQDGSLAPFCYRVVPVRNITKLSRSRPNDCAMHLVIFMNLIIILLFLFYMAEHFYMTD